MEMHYLDGYQFYSRKEAQDKIKNVVPKKEQKYFFVEKEEKPSFYSSDMKWKQTWTIRVKDYSKIKIVQEPEEY
jgi:hypothetical protein